MGPYRRFTRQWVVAFLLLTGSMALLNRLVDPFDYYRDTAITRRTGAFPGASVWLFYA